MRFPQENLSDRPKERYSVYPGPLSQESFWHCVLLAKQPGQLSVPRRADGVPTSEILKEEEQRLVEMEKLNFLKRLEAFYSNNNSLEAHMQRYVLSLDSRLKSGGSVHVTDLWLAGNILGFRIRCVMSEMVWSQMNAATDMNLVQTSPDCIYGRVGDPIRLRVIWAPLKDDDGNVVHQYNFFSLDPAGSKLLENEQQVDEYPVEGPDIFPKPVPMTHFDSSEQEALVPAPAECPKPDATVHPATHDLSHILLIQKTWLNKILYEGKRVELRSKRTSVRGTIGLGWQGKIYGKASLVDCFEVTSDWKQAHKHLHQCDDSNLLEKYNYAWVLSNVAVLEEGVEFHKPQGAVVWVKLNRESPKKTQSLEDLTEVVVLRVQSMVLDKLFNSMYNTLILENDSLACGVDEIFVGLNQRDLVYGKLQLGPCIPYSKDLENRALNVTGGRNPENVMREFVKVTPFPRAIGKGCGCGNQKFAVYLEKCLEKDLRRNNLDPIIPKSDLPGLVLKEVAHHYIQALTPQFIDRLRLVVGALHGATVRIATTCSGVESVPAIAKALFRHMGEGNT